MMMNDMALTVISVVVALMYIWFAYEQWRFKYNQKKKRDESAD